jgi:uncharacterized membrane protein SpoIIM required for sporulation
MKSLMLIKLFFAFGAPELIILLILGGIVAFVVWIIKLLSKK